MTYDLTDIELSALEREIVDAEKQRMTRRLFVTADVRAMYDELKRRRQEAKAKEKP